jgi:hypothetical protein
MCDCFAVLTLLFTCLMKDCDFDWHCVGDLVCSHADVGETPPVDGCLGERSPGLDYCASPNGCVVDDDCPAYPCSSQGPCPKNVCSDGKCNVVESCGPNLCNPGEYCCKSILKVFYHTSPLFHLEPCLTFELLFPIIQATKAAGL